MLTPHFATHILPHMEGKRVILLWKYASSFWSLDPESHSTKMILML